MSIFGRKKEPFPGEERPAEVKELPLEEKDGVLVVQQQLPAVPPLQPTPKKAEATGEESLEEKEATATPPQGALKARRREKEKRNRMLSALGVTALYLVLAFLLFQNANNAVIPGAIASMRYAVPLPPAAVKAAKFTMANPNVTADFSAAYWYESPKETLANERGKVETPTLFVDGDMATVLRLNFLHGNYPSALEKNGLAVSEGLAWDLFGGSDVVGAKIEWNGEVFVVRGVFAGDELLLLAQIDAAETKIPGFSGVELAGEPVGGDVREGAKAYAKQAGLGEPDVILNSNTLPGILALLAWLPVGLLTLWFVYKSLGLLHAAPFWKRQLAWLAILLLLAVFIPKALSMLPGWMIPTRWSDFEHWRLLLKEMNHRFTQWLAVTPSLRDIQLKKQLLVQVLLFVPALLAVLSMVRQWGRHIKRKEAATRFAALGQKKPPVAEEQEQAPLLPPHLTGEESPVQQ